MRGPRTGSDEFSRGSVVRQHLKSVAIGLGGGAVLPGLLAGLRAGAFVSNGGTLADAFHFLFRWHFLFSYLALSAMIYQRHRYDAEEDELED